MSLPRIKISIISFFILFGLILRTISLIETAQFWGDEGRDLVVASHLVRRGDVPLRGPASHRLYSPATYFWVYSFLYFLSFENEKSLQYLTVIIHSLLAFVLFFFLNDYSSDFAAWVGIGIYLFSPHFIWTHRTLTQPHLMSLLLIPGLFFIYRGLRKKGSIFWIGYLLVVVTMQIYNTGILLFPGLLFVLIRYLTQIRGSKQSLIKIFILSVLLFFPYIFIIKENAIRLFSNTETQSYIHFSISTLADGLRIFYSYTFYKKGGIILLILFLMSFILHLFFWRKQSFAKKSLFIFLISPIVLIFIIFLIAPEVRRLPPSSYLFDLFIMIVGLSSLSAIYKYRFIVVLLVFSLFPAYFSKTSFSSFLHPKPRSLISSYKYNLGVSDQILDFLRKEQIPMQEVEIRYDNRYVSNYDQGILYYFLEKKTGQLLSELYSENWIRSLRYERNNVLLVVCSDHPFYPFLHEQFSTFIPFCENDITRSLSKEWRLYKTVSYDGFTLLLLMKRLV